MIKHIDVHTLKSKRDNDPSLCLIDVREDDEYQSSRIPGTIHIPKDQICERIAAYVPNRDQAIYLHCRGGVRSLYAAERLEEMGYTELYSVDGGIAEWAENGYDVSRSSHEKKNN